MYYYIYIYIYICTELNSEFEVAISLSPKWLTGRKTRARGGCLTSPEIPWNPPRLYPASFFSYHISSTWKTSFLSFSLQPRHCKTVTVTVSNTHNRFFNKHNSCLSFSLGRRGGRCNFELFAVWMNLDASSHDSALFITIWHSTETKKLCSITASETLLHVMTHRLLSISDTRPWQKIWLREMYMYVRDSTQKDVCMYVCMYEIRLRNESAKLCRLGYRVCSLPACVWVVLHLQWGSSSAFTVRGL